MEIEENQLTCEIYTALRKSVDWMIGSEEQLRNSVSNTYYNVVAYIDDEPIGMARVIGDGMYFLIVDVIVAPPYQGKGYGTQMLERILSHIEASSPIGSRISVQLIAEKGREAFYDTYS